MSLVQVQGNASGTGTLTIAAPNTNSNYTQTLPTASGILVSTGDTGTVTSTMLATAVTPIGAGQTWQNVAGSRAVGTTYTNTTGRPIQVQVCSRSSVGNNVARLTIDGIIVSAFKDNDYYTASAITPHSITNMGLVPAGSTYSITNSNSGTAIQYWAELR
jgi:hypothetical protein